MIPKYRVGQRCELLPPAKPQFSTYIGRHVTITRLGTPHKGRVCYEVDALPRIRVMESSLRPLDDKWSPPLGSWREIAKLLGTDIRKVTVRAALER